VQAARCAIPRHRDRFARQSTSRFGTIGAMLPRMSQTPRLRMSAIEDPEDRHYDETEERDGPRWEEEPHADGEIPRLETGYRIALTLLFAIAASAIRTVLGLIVIFELLSTLITQRPPGLRVRELANRITAYYYRLLRYVTYNESRVPFPFSDFPEPLEPDAFRAEDRDSEVLDTDRP
jgi:hypothetical protein